MFVVYIYSIRTLQRKLYAAITDTSQLMLHSEIIAVCSQIHTKHINTLCGQNVPRSKHTPSRL
jgi:hypothetical protein